MSTLKTASELGLYLGTAADISELVGAAYGVDGVILQQADLAPEFWDLETGLLGELFQKATNYRLRLALVLPNPERYGPRLGELAYEHRRHPLIRFFADEAAARAWR